MSPSIDSYEAWLALTPSQRLEEMLTWNVYVGEGRGFVICAAGRLAIQSKGLIIDAQPGIYHGGGYVIHAFVKKEDLPKMPPPMSQEFEGFRIFWIQFRGQPDPP